MSERIELMRLLLTAAGTGTAFGYAQAKARWFPDVVLFTADINPAERVTASLFAEQHVVLGESIAEDYFQILDEVLHQHNIDVYIPLIDVEVAKAAAIGGNLSSSPACNNSAFCNAALEKSRYSQLLKTDGWSGVSGITTLRPMPLDDWDTKLPAIVKQDGGFGGRGTCLVKSRDEAHPLMEQGGHLYPYIEGEEYTVDCFPLEGRVVTSVRQRLEIKSGVCTKARITQDENLHLFAQHLCQKFSLTHPFCFQTRRADDCHCLIDINPRLGAGSSMSALNGTDFFAAHLAALSGDRPEKFLNPHFSECVVTRQYSDYLMNARP